MANDREVQGSVLKGEVVGKTSDFVKPREVRLYRANVNGVDTYFVSSSPAEVLGGEEYFGFVSEAGGKLFRNFDSWIRRKHGVSAEELRKTLETEGSKGLAFYLCEIVRYSGGIQEAVKGFLRVIPEDKATSARNQRKRELGRHRDTLLQMAEAYRRGESPEGDILEVTEKFEGEYQLADEDELLSGYLGLRRLHGEELEKFDLSKALSIEKASDNLNLETRVAMGKLDVVHRHGGLVPIKDVEPIIKVQSGGRKYNFRSVNVDEAEQEEFNRTYKVIMVMGLLERVLGTSEVNRIETKFNQIKETEEERRLYDLAAVSLRDVLNEFEKTAKLETSKEGREVMIVGLDETAEGLKKLQFKPNLEPGEVKSYTKESGEFIAGVQHTAIACEKGVFAMLDDPEYNRQMDLIEGKLPKLLAERTEKL